jgi:hypothetical protein
MTAELRIGRLVFLFTGSILLIVWKRRTRHLQFAIVQFLLSADHRRRLRVVNHLGATPAAAIQ